MSRDSKLKQMVREAGPYATPGERFDEPVPVSRDELEPLHCPDCGPVEGQAVISCNGEQFYVETKCGRAGPDADTEAEAVAAWNRRG